jgi:hypothetical protein
MDQSLTLANFTSAVKTLLTGGISYAAGKGWITSDAASNFMILAVAAIPMLYSWYQNYMSKLAKETERTNGVRAGIAMANDDSVATPPPASVGPMEAKSIVAAYAPSQGAAT